MPMLARPIAVTADDEHEFLLAMEAYKKQSGRNFPTWSEILEVLLSLGYAKRIWKPVGTWSPIPSSDFRPSGEIGESSGVFGWSSRVETSMEH
jgi:hypothetical protein